MDQVSKRKFAYCFQWSPSASQIWRCSTSQWILPLQNPKDIADGGSPPPLLPGNSYDTDRTHKYSIYKILLPDLYFWRELEARRELTIHDNTANVTECLLIFFSHREINTKSTTSPYAVHCGTCASTQCPGTGHGNSSSLPFSAVGRETQRVSFRN